MSKGRSSNADEVGPGILAIATPRMNQGDPKQMLQTLYL